MTKLVSAKYSQKAKAVFKRNDQQFYDILECLCDSFEIINKNGIVEKVSGNFEKIYGVPNEEAVGKTLSEMESKKICNPSVGIRVLKSKEKESVLEMTTAGKYLMCHAAPIFDENGEITKIISYTRDVTQYEELRDEYNRLQKVNDSYIGQLQQLRDENKRQNKIIGVSAMVKNLIQTIDKVAKFDENVLITGESGVGKTLFAAEIHAISQRKNHPFVTINCGAIPENLLESELFGYEKGAFTGADRGGKPGLIEIADKGVLFLDEIGDLPLHMQVKLLKVVQDKKTTRVGGIKERDVDFRLIAATNKDMKKLIASNRFREDLYYRLNVLSIHIPPLRERKEDISHLVFHFTKKYNARYNINHTFSNEAIRYMEEYSWPGNTRELENIIQRTIITAEEYVITKEALPSHIYARDTIEPNHIKERTLKEMLDDIERQIVLKCYEEHSSTVKVAKALGISQSSASLKLQKYLNGERVRSKE